MNIIEKAELLISSDEVKEASVDLIGDILSAMHGNIMSTAKVIKSCKGSVAFIETQLFLERFEAFLSGICTDDKNIRSMGEILNKYEQDPEFAKRILDKIIKVDTLQKTKYITNLTLSLRYGYLTKKEYLILCRIVVNVIEEDLQYLKQHITRNTIESNEFTEELQDHGLVYMGDPGMVYGKWAFYLDKYGLSYGDEKYKYNGEPDFVPVKFPNKADLIYAEVSSNQDDGDQMT